MKLLLIFILSASLFAESIEDIVKTALKNNPNLKSIEELVRLKETKTKRSKNLQNPVLKIGINDLRLDNPSRRDLEPMQSEYISIKQQFPYFGKRDLNKRLAISEKDITFANYLEAKNYLVKSIYLNITDYIEINESLKIFNKYIDLTKQSIDLYRSFSITNDSSHLFLMKSELFLTNLKTKTVDYNSKLEEILQNISYLASKKIVKIDYDINHLSKIDFKGVKKNPKLIALSEKIRYQKHKIARVKLDNFSDFAIEAGYYRRDNFQDYISLGISFSLPIYGTENIRLEEEKIKKISLSMKKRDFENYLLSRLALLKIRYDSLKKKIELIEKESLPKIEHMFELTNAGVISGSTLFKYIDTLERRFDLELKLIKFKAQLIRTKAQILWLEGRTQ
ncbi:TolC family protein [Nitrosophilus labii]|uniref:TolC family protein n=1 Tax=Nitrosophilus labii TaxID=2706014 RepID=UPI0016574073|nr:TolC family protein [Nitrosophilus labii]